MRITRIKLFNFSSYLGEYELDLSVKPGKNIILIGGQNGSGKTSLFTAIKLALYGPLCFRFQSKNNQYTMRIKDLISHDAYAQSEVNAFIEVEIELPHKTGKKTYVIRREWIYADQKLNESDIVWDNGELLPEEDFDYFQNYLYSIIPPKMFDFFFFDGEEVAGFFTSGGNAYIRDAIFTLDSYDTFRLIERFSRRYVVNESDSQQYSKLYEEYEGIYNLLDNAEEVLQKRKARIDIIHSEMNRLDGELSALEEQYRKSGGLSKTKRKNLQKEAQEWEKSRENASRDVRKYVEDLMPLVLTKPISDKMQEQMEKEEQMQRFRALQNTLSSNTLDPIVTEALRDYPDIDVISITKQISDSLIGSVKPNIDTDSFQFLHDFSNEQRDLVKYAMNQIAEFDRENLISLIQMKGKASVEGARIREILENSMDEHEVESYQQKKETIRETIITLKDELIMLEEEDANHTLSLKQAENRQKALRKTLTNLSRKLNAVKYTPLISDMMNKMLQDLLDSKRTRIEEETLHLSKEILRKEHFIDHIELDDKFNFALFREQSYSYSELSALYHNIGADELVYRIGSRGLQILLETNGLASVKDLKHFFVRDNDQATIYDNQQYPLYSRIEFQQLSKGEKQIFILALYWAIIQSSGKDIPFIIDTPYARIDMEHREQIAEKMFPTISGQVVIFSTDEEITRQYYDAISPYISREYTLFYNEADKKSEIRNGYFEKGA